MRPSVRTVARAVHPGARGLSALTARRSLTMLGWHRIGHSDDGLTTTFDDFRRHLDVIEDWGASIISIDEALARRQTGDLPQRAVVLTFDDGYASIVEQAWPELHRRGMPATLYAVSGYLSATRRLPWDHGHGDSDLTRLITADALGEICDSGMDIGSHTVTHRWLPGLSADEVVAEVTDSRSALEDLLQRPIRSFSYPMGGLNRQIRQAVQEAGYTSAVTTVRGRIGRGHDDLTLRRAFAFDRAGDLRRQLDGAFTWMRPLERSRNRKAPTW